MKGTKYDQPVGPESIGSITGWKECSAKCYEKTTCLYWNWENADGTNANTCTLMKDYAIDVADPNFVGGNRECYDISTFLIVIITF